LVGGCGFLAREAERPAAVSLPSEEGTQIGGDQGAEELAVDRQAEA
jgi:hypothetical protein